MKWPVGAVVTSSWFRKSNVSAQLVARYLKSGWIKSIGRGAFIRSDETPDWKGAVYTLQDQLGFSVYVGGETALMLKGLGMFIPLGQGMQVLLLSEKKEKLPPWFTQNDWSVQIRHINSSLFKGSDPSWFMQYPQDRLIIRIASPERAIMELMHLATTNDMISHAIELTSHLNTLRPEIVQSLLESCRSFKVKRLFLWSVENAGHEWFKEIKTQRIDLGKGKRMVYRNGRLDTKYMITVPTGENEYAKA